MKIYNKEYSKFPNFNKINMGGGKMVSCQLFILIDGNEKYISSENGNFTIHAYGFKNTAINLWTPVLSLVPVRELVSNLKTVLNQVCLRFLSFISSSFVSKMSLCKPSVKWIGIDTTWIFWQHCGT